MSGQYLHKSALFGPGVKSFFDVLLASLLLHPEMELLGRDLLGFGPTWGSLTQHERNLAKMLPPPKRMDRRPTKAVYSLNIAPELPTDIREGIQQQALDARAKLDLLENLFNF